jgi:hypothetical protein
MERELTCEATVRPDGQLTLPGDIASALAAHSAERVQLRIAFPTAPPSPDAWDLLDRMVASAQPGRSECLAEEHDQIVYGRG